MDIRPEALADTAEVAAWYEARQAGLGERSTREVIAAMSKSEVSDPAVLKAVVSLPAPQPSTLNPQPRHGTTAR